MKISFVLNGNKVECEIEKNERLLYTLREKFSIKSVKEGCAIGECGTCTVLIDNEPHYSCLTLSSKVNGHDVKTVEFLNSKNGLHPLQEAFIKEGAVQCGYCTPGMLLTAYSLLIKEKNPDINKIKEAISGNLCRCTGYKQIIDAIKAAHSDKNWDMIPKKQEIGVLKKKKEDILKALTENKGYKIIAGGTDLLVKERKEERKYNYIELSNIDDLNMIKEEGDSILIGATVTHTDLNKNEIINKKAKSLAIACGTIGSPQIRNMGTIGGNIVNASPAADSIPPLLIHDAVCVLESLGRIKEIPLSDFIVAPYKTSIEENELLSCIKITGLYGYEEGYEKVAKRASLAIARLSVAWAIKEKNGIFEDVRFSIGSCTPMPFRPKDMENFLKGKKREELVIKEAVSMVLKGIIEKSGMRPSYRYKLPVLDGLITKILRG